MTQDQLVVFNPSTCTGLAGQWIVQNCSGGRSISKCPWYGMPLSQVTNEVTRLRDPKRTSTLEEDAPVGVRGVTPIDRMNDFNPHTRLGGVG